jgi:hypothetical protein
MQDTIVSTADAHAIRIGCSGWNYKHWRDAFYPKDLPVRRWFEFYAQHFDTVEINNSFYRLPSPETFAKWRDQAPPGFCYTVKANRYITQAKKLLDPEEPLDRMMTSVRHLEDRLGPILYQLPPSLGLNLERLEQFLAVLPKDVNSVFEFRDKSWYVRRLTSCSNAMGLPSAPTTCAGQHRNVSPSVRSPTSAFMVAQGNIGAATPAIACWAGPTGCWSNQSQAGQSGPISTTTSMPTPSTTPRR